MALIQANNTCILISTVISNVVFSSIMAITNENNFHKRLILLTAKLIPNTHNFLQFNTFVVKSHVTKRKYGGTTSQDITISIDTC